MRRPKSHFENHPGVRSGIFYLLLVLLVLQGVKLGIRSWTLNHNDKIEAAEKSELDPRLETIRENLNSRRTWTLRPLDPNGLDDYRGYLLGIPFSALDSLYRYRSQNGILRNMEQFQAVTHISDSLCLRLEPYFRFPPERQARSRALPTKRDLNTATADQLMVVQGIGPVLSSRIVRFREALGGFLTAAQLLDVYGLSPEVARATLELFPLRSVPDIRRLDVNLASLEELSALVYLNHKMARDIIAHRARIGGFRSIDELRQVESLPKDRIDRIALYLQF